MSQGETDWPPSIGERGRHSPDSRRPTWSCFCSSFAPVGVPRLRKSPVQGAYSPLGRSAGSVGRAVVRARAHVCVLRQTVAQGSSKVFKASFGVDQARVKGRELDALSPSWTGSQLSVIATARPLPLCSHGKLIPEVSTPCASTST